MTFSGAQATSQGAKVLGIAQTSVAGGIDCAVAVDGSVIVEAGAYIAIGDSLICDNQGRAIPSTGALAVKAGATAVTSTAANGAAILQGGDPPEFVFADALEAASEAGKKIEVLLRR
ncbi:MAG: capsid cement protein [Rhodospirillaceae bacterium]